MVENDAVAVRGVAQLTGGAEIDQPVTSRADGRKQLNVAIDQDEGCGQIVVDAAPAGVADVSAAAGRLAGRHSSSTASKSLRTFRRDGSLVKWFRRC